MGYPNSTLTPLPSTEKDQLLQKENIDSKFGESLTQIDFTPPIVNRGQDSADQTLTLEQAARIIEASLRETQPEWDSPPLDVQPSNSSSTPLATSTAQAPNVVDGHSDHADINSGTIQPVIASTTSDIVRLLQNHQFRFYNDLSCPIFQAMVLVSTGQGYMTVAVRGDDGTAITSTELWERLNGGFKVRKPDPRYVLVTEKGDCFQ